MNSEHQKFSRRDEQQRRREFEHRVTASSRNRLLLFLVFAIVIICVICYVVSTPNSPPGMDGGADDGGANTIKF